MKTVPFLIVGALFLLKLVANALAPVSLFRRPLGPKGEEPGVSLMPYVEVMLLVLLLGLASVGWAPIGAITTVSGGVVAILTSYLLMFIVAVVLASLNQLLGRRRCCHRR
jgi:hypothetical protein